MKIEISVFVDYPRYIRAGENNPGFEVDIQKKMEDELEKVSNEMDLRTALTLAAKKVFPDKYIYFGGGHIAIHEQPGKPRDLMITWR